MIAWKVFKDAPKRECVAEGTLPVERVLLDGGEGAYDSDVHTRGFQLMPLFRENALALLQESRENEPLASSSSCAKFPIANESLLVGGKDANGPKEQEKERANEWHCRLEVVRSPRSTALDVKCGPHTWFDAKAARGAAYRARGNNAFKLEKYTAAIRAYNKVSSSSIWAEWGILGFESLVYAIVLQALRWLECPEGCNYDAEEASIVDAMAAACHSNLATSFWKLHNTSACIEHATRALQHDPEHVKALFRRSQAYLSAKAFDNAVEDLARAQRLDPDSKLIHAALERAQSAQTQFQQKQKAVFAKMF